MYFSNSNYSLRILLFFSTGGPVSSVGPPATTSHALGVKQERMEDDTFEHGAMSEHLEEVRSSFFQTFRFWGIFCPNFDLMAGL